MKCVFLLLVVVVGVFVVQCEHLVVGNVSNRVRLANINETRFQYNAFPFMKRVKYYFFSDLQNRKIAGIQALDNLHSKASINITAGGVGYPFVNMRVKSERGHGLDYDIGIYVNEDYIR